jgi:hypothetical protein
MSVHRQVHAGGHREGGEMGEWMWVTIVSTRRKKKKRKEGKKYSHDHRKREAGMHEWARTRVGEGRHARWWA